MLGSAGLPAGQSTEDQLMTDDAARLYEQGCILKNHIALRTRGGRPPRPPASIDRL